MSTGGLTGVLGQCAQIYRELIKAQIPPNVADQLELWQIASLLGEDAKTESTSDRLLRLRVEAAREGREVDSRGVTVGISDEQMAAILDSATGGTSPNPTP